MRAIRDYVGYELEWVRSRWFRGEYELRLGGGEPLAYLRMHGGLRAEASLVDGNFSLRRKGFWKPKLLITQTETQLPVAELSRVGSGGTLDFADGQTQQYVWRKAGTLSTEYFWVDSAGWPVLHIYPSMWKFSAKVAFEPVASQIGEIGLLTLLAGFLAIIAYQESAATVTATAIMTAG
ncbi:MAG TPA: hypothetical protein VFU63_03215 [Ktedonobacterales bacterium]|nr:hypothetical protein [Ktedonobacterales bacterium]